MRPTLSTKLTTGRGSSQEASDNGSPAWSAANPGCSSAGSSTTTKPVLRDSCASTTRPAIYDNTSVSSGSVLYGSSLTGGLHLSGSQGYGGSRIGHAGG